MVDCSAMGWEESLECLAAVSSSSSGLLLPLTIGWIAFWAIAIFLYLTKRNIFAFVAYIVGFFFLFLGLFAAIDETAISNPATANMLQMFVFPLTWILVGSVIAFILYIFLGTMVRMAQTFGIKVSDWWHEGKY